MILVAALAIVVLTVPLRGGSLATLSSVRIRHPWSAVLALIAQLMIITVAPQALPAAAMGVIHLGTYILVLGFIWWNRRLPGIWLIATGGLANFAAITANGGVMPASPSALAAAGRSLQEVGFVNSGPVSDPRLAYLGDVLAWPEPLPLANVFSVGDVVLVVGIAVALHTICVARPRETV